MYKVDVIVNTTNDKLDLNANPCGRALLKVGGQELKDACQQVGNLPVGKIAMTKPGKLDCKLVYHVNCAAWRDRQGELVRWQSVFILSRFFRFFSFFSLLVL